MCVGIGKHWKLLLQQAVEVVNGVLAGLQYVADPYLRSSISCWAKLG